MHEPVETWTVAIDADTSRLQQELANATRFGRQFGAALTNAFQGVAVRGRDLGDVLRSLTLSLSRMALQAAFRPLEQGLASLFGRAVSGAIPFARGGVVQNALPVPFASGGVIASPVTFPLAGGRIGLAGERGPEAIMPLARGPDGRLGVRAPGGAGVSVTINVSTPDAESFRRSETQIAAMLARAVALGQRNL
ncbi:MAG: phage tail tape measure protein [Hyphomicrobiaceae bacterium]|nr:phage tail tape measure protein [Hyphomicrobiaceae bacterium]